MARKQIVDLDSLELREKSDGFIEGVCNRFWKCIGDAVTSMLPIIEWLVQYQWRTDLIKDLIAGITVGIFQIPQGMAYGMLGNLEPINGLYMAFFPAFIYVIFGSSRHNSIGTFAVICLMSGKPILEYSTENNEDSTDNVSNTTSLPKENEDVITKLEVAVTLAFTVALIHVAMFILRLGVVSRLLSETVVSSFLTGCAIHVLMSQIKDLFGLPLERRSGYFRNVYVLYYACIILPKANIATVITSFIALLIMMLNNELLKPYLSKKCKIPVPIELIVMILATVISYYLKLNSLYGVTIVGQIPSGLPAPVVPTFSLMATLVVDALSIAIVSFAITVSLARLFAQKLMYEINPNQELLALGLCNLFGSFFSCMPVSAALARTSVQYAAGGVTQLTTLINCILILFVLLWIGPLFYFLPKCILASVIVIALKGMILEVRNLVRLWYLSKMEAFIWVATFLLVALIDIIIGLSVGVVMSIISICFQSCRPNNCLLGVLVNTETYLDVNRYKQVQEVEGIKIFHFVGCINFITKTMFKSELLEKINFNPKKLIQENKMKSQDISNDKLPLLFKYLILDLSGVIYIDPVGVSELITIYNEFKNVNIDVYLICTSGRVYDNIMKGDLYENKTKTFTIFPAVHDAVLYAQQNKVKDK